MEKSFWNGYYKHEIAGDNVMTREPSTFARFCARYLRPCDTVVDLGCGNGRDSVYFSSMVRKVYAVDSSECVARYFEGTGVQFVNKSMDELEGREIDGNVAYSRFSLHSITRAAQDKLFKWVADNDYDLFCIETRSVNDPRYGKGVVSEEDPDAFVDTHYRRFTRLSDLTRSLRHDYGFSILHAEEDFTNATYRDDHAVVNRVVCTHISDPQGVSSG